MRKFRFFILTFLSSLLISSSCFSKTYYYNGSGSFVSPDGVILTANHVIERAKEIRVVYNNRVYKARVIDADSRHDVALIKIDVDESVPFLNIERPVNKETVTLYGYGGDRSLEIKNGTVNFNENYSTYYGINILSCGGDSGGPIVNKNNNLVGILLQGSIKDRVGSEDHFCSTLSYSADIDYVIKILNNNHIYINPVDHTHSDVIPLFISTTVEE
jgi:hypothetical protein